MLEPKLTFFLFLSKHKTISRVLRLWSPLRKISNFWKLHKCNSRYRFNHISTLRPINPLWRNDLRLKKSSYRNTLNLFYHKSFRDTSLFYFPTAKLQLTPSTFQNLRLKLCIHYIWYLCGSLNASESSQWEDHYIHTYVYNIQVCNRSNDYADPYLAAYRCCWLSCHCHCHQSHQNHRTVTNSQTVTTTT